MDKLAFLVLVLFLVWFSINLGINADKRDEKRKQDKKEYLQELFKNCQDTLNSIDNKKKLNFLACQEILTY